MCHQLVSLRGLDSLVALVKDGSLRNYNDAVLVACLAVLRRVAHHCGHGVFDSLDARDLIDPKLMDSFLENSSNIGSLKNVISLAAMNIKDKVVKTDELKQRKNQKLKE